MKRTRLLVIFVFALLFLQGLLPRAHAQTGGGYDLIWYTVDSGGGYSSGGEYSVVGTIGQVDGGLLSGGDYILSGGFWGASNLVTANYRVFLPTILR